MSSDHAHVVTIDRAHQRTRRPWTRWTMWMMILGGSVLLLNAYLHRVRLDDNARVVVLGFLLSVGTHVIASDTAHWQRRCFVERMAQAIHARRCWHTCTVVVCADPTVATPFTNALWARIQRQRNRHAMTVLVCHTPAELRPLLTIRPRSRVVVVTTGSTWIATTGGPR
jgi:hypothetical protein